MSFGFAVQHLLLETMNHFLVFVRSAQYHEYSTWKLIETMAEELDMQIGAVRTAKFKILKRLKEEFGELLE